MAELWVVTRYGVADLLGQQTKAKLYDGSMSIRPDLRSLVESLSTSLPLEPGDQRIEEESYTIRLYATGDHPQQSHPEHTVVRPLRLEGDIQSTILTIRDTLRRHGRRRATWELGPSAAPANLRQQLLAAGMKPYQQENDVGMVLQTAPPETGSPVHTSLIHASLVHTRRAQTVADYVEAFEVMHAVFAQRQETAREREERAQQTCELDAAGRGALFLATLNGKPVAVGRSIYLTDAVALIGGCTLPTARGHGAYRSLILAPASTTPPAAKLPRSWSKQDQCLARSWKKSALNPSPKSVCCWTSRFFRRPDHQ